MPNWRNIVKQKDSETFHDALICQYRDQIQGALQACESDHKTRVDLGQLTRKFKEIVRAAQNDGLTEDEIMALIDETTRYVEPLKKAA